MSEDRIFVAEKLGDEPFRFDESVARVFPDMLRRSIPGYQASLDTIGALARRYVRPGSHCYDLGCSLGAATLAMRQGIEANGCRIIAVDNAPAMTARCEQLLAADSRENGNRVAVDVILGNIEDLAISNASMVVLNYTLQFLDVGLRAAFIRRILDGLVAGGILLLSEKVLDEDPVMESLMVDLYHDFKRRNGYSALEIARKRAALENVLVPETIADHRARLAAAGFAGSTVWQRHFNFVSMIAYKANA
jgi:tRNA (cmo5U34)-methyltransferase